MTGEDTVGKLQTIQTYLQQIQADGWLLYGFRDQNPIALSVSGLLNGGSRRWFLWIPATGRPSWIGQAIERTNFLDLPDDLDGQVYLYVSWQDLEDRLRQVVRRGNEPADTIIMEYSPDNAIPYVSRVDAGTQELVSRCTGAKIRSSADAVQLVAAVISPEHLEGHKRAADLCIGVKNAAFDFIAESVQKDKAITEYDAQQFIASEFERVGMAPAKSIVAVNGNAADPHYFPSEQIHSPIRRGDVVLIDLWNRESGDPEACFADITWTAFCGEVVPDTVQKVFGIVRDARDRAVEFMNDGLTDGADVYGYEVDDACREVITVAGYREAFFHRTGHSLGPTGHFIGVNIDNLETQDRRKLVPGVMFSIEPGIYVKDFDFDGSSPPKGLGVRSEINCFVHEKRVEVTTLPLQTEMTPLLA